MNFIDNVTFYTIANLRYGVREAGPRQGRPLVLLHGLLDTGASFTPLVEAIESRRPGIFRYIAPDWRGHGATEHRADSYWFPEYLRDLEALLTATVGRHGPPAVLIGHSMGGQVASLYAGARPKHVSRLITLDSLNVPDADTCDAVARYRRWLDVQAKPPSPRIYASVAAIAARIGQRYPELNARQRHFLAIQWSEPTADGGGRRMRFDAWHRQPTPYGFRADEAKALWRAVEAGVLCIDAADSPARRLVDETEMAQRRGCFQALRHVVIQRCGHMLHLQRPDAVAAQICMFL